MTGHLTRREVEVVVSEARAWRNAELAATLRQMWKVFAKLAPKFRPPATPAPAAWRWRSR